MKAPPPQPKFADQSLLFGEADRRLEIWAKRPVFAVLTEVKVAQYETNRVECVRLGRNQRRMSASERKEQLALLISCAQTDEAQKGRGSGTQTIRSGCTQTGEA